MNRRRLCLAATMLGALLFAASPSHAQVKTAGPVAPAQRVIIDVDLTKGDAGPGKVTGGVWEKGWRATGGKDERIVYDAGRTVKNGYLEVSFTMNTSPIGDTPQKINYFGLHEDAGLKQEIGDADILYARTGNPAYKFSKIKAAGKKFDRNEWEQSVGSLSDWITDDTTVHQVRLEWKDGVASFYDTKGAKSSCPADTTCGGAYPVDELRYVFLGSDNYKNVSLKGIRFLRVKLVDYGE